VPKLAAAVFVGLASSATVVATTAAPTRSSLRWAASPFVRSCDTAVYGDFGSLAALAAAEHPVGPFAFVSISRGADDEAGERPSR
jgi:hypothetical protein